MFADVIYEGDHTKSVQDQWNDLHLNVNHDGYIFILNDTDVLDDTRLVRLWARELSGSAFATKRYSMYDGSEYRVDGLFKPYYTYPMFPYRADGTMVRYGNIWVPNYSLLYPYIQDPHLKVLDYQNYQEYDTAPTLESLQFGAVL